MSTTVHQWLLAICALVVVGIGRASHANEVVLSDSFTGPSGSWSVAFQNALGWQSGYANGKFVVTDITPSVVNPGSGGVWAVADLEHELPPMGDCELVASIDWDSAGSNQAMQYLTLEAIASDGSVVAGVGYSDAWVLSRGSRVAYLSNGSSFSSGENSLPFAGAAVLRIQRIGSFVFVQWNNQTQLSGFLSDIPISRVRFRFQYYAYSGSGGPSFFGTESIDSIQVAGQVLPTTPAWTVGTVTASGFAESEKGSDSAFAETAVLPASMSGGGSTGSGPIFGSVSTDGAVLPIGSGFEIRVAAAGSATNAAPGCACSLSLSLSAFATLFLPVGYQFEIVGAGAFQSMKFTALSGSVGVETLAAGTYSMSHFLSISLSGSEESDATQFEWTLRLWPLGAAGVQDLNADGAVNAADLATLLAAWGTPDADLNGDGTTGAPDLAILLAAWTG